MDIQGRIARNSAASVSIWIGSKSYTGGIPSQNSPHTIKNITLNEWEHAYTREQAAFPAVSNA